MSPLTRRRLLASLAATPLSALAARHAMAQNAGLVSSHVCMVQRETTAGPYYTDPKLMRANITEGLAGLPLALALQVVTADCTPIRGARVDIWHCDALGRYSGFARENTEGQTFLRGSQDTGEGGVARFATIYPGWYPGRAVHIHYKVFLGDGAALTSQLFFPEAISEQVYAKRAPYMARGRPDRLNAADAIATRAGKGAVAAVSARPGGLEASLVVGVA